MALTKKQKTNTIKDVKVHDEDTGSAPVQIALITRRINDLSDHLKKHKKDTSSRRGLLQLVADRRKHVKYLQKKNPKEYNSLAKKIGLKVLKTVE